LGDKATLRDDYKELALITLLHLGGILPNEISIYTSRAHHHARWMGKIIYSIKITLFRDQLGEVFESDLFHSIQNFATFLALFYVKYCLCSTNAPDASQLNLNFTIFNIEKC